MGGHSSILRLIRDGQGGAIITLVTGLALLACDAGRGIVIDEVDAQADSAVRRDMGIDAAADAADASCTTQLGCADFPGAECGVVPDGCGGAIDLVADCGAGGCTPPEECNGGDVGETLCGAPDLPLPAYCDPTVGWDVAWQTEEATLLQRINELRETGADCGTSGAFGPTHTLTIAPTLQCAARVHSMDMHNRGFFSHTNPDGDTPTVRFAAAGWPDSVFDEFIARGHGTAEASFTAFRGSDPHCAHLMSPDIVQVGIGYYLGTDTFGDYVTICFGGP